MTHGCREEEEEEEEGEMEEGEDLEEEGQGAGGEASRREEPLRHGWHGLQCCVRGAGGVVATMS